MLVLALLYIALPLWAKLLVLTISAFVPDPFFVFDEVFMMASTIKHTMRIFALNEWVCEHKRLTACIIIAVVFLIILLLISFIIPFI